MTDIDSILDRIRSFASKHGRKRIITRETGMSPTSLTGIDDKGWNPSADTIRKIERVIQNHPADEPDPPQQPD